MRRWTTLCCVTLWAAWPAAAAAPAAGAEEAQDLPDGAVARLGEMRYRHGAFIRGVAIVDDGRTIVSVGGQSSSYHNVKLWDARTGRLLETLGGVDAYVTSTAVCPAQTVLAVGSNRGRIHVFDLEARRQVRTLKDDAGSVSGLAFGPEGQRLYAASYRGVRVWDVETGERRGRWAAKCQSVAVSPDGKRVALGRYHYGTGKDRNAVTVHDAETGELVRRLTKAQRRFNAVGFSPDGSRLAAAGWGGRHGLVVWDAETGKEAFELATGQRPVLRFSFSPDGNRLAAVVTSDRSIRVWDLTSRKQLREFADNPGTMYDVAFGPEGRMVAAGGGYGLIRLWDVETGKEVSHQRGHLGPLQAVCLSDDGRYAVTGDLTGKVLLWDVAAGEGRPLADTDEKVHVVAFGPEADSVLVGNRDGQVRRIRLADGETTRRRKGDTILAAGRLSGAERVFLLEEDGDLFGESLTEADAAPVARDVVSPGRRNRHFRGGLSGDGRWAALLERNAVFLVETRTKHRIQLSPMQRVVHGLSVLAEPYAFDAASQYLAAANGSDLSVFECDTGRLVDRLTLGRGVQTVSSAFSPDGDLLAGGWADGRIGVWDLASGKRAATFAVDHGGGEGKPRRAPRGVQGESVTSLAFAAGVGRLISGHNDSLAYVWDVEGLRRSRPAAAGRDVDALWEDLAGDDPLQALRSSRALVRLGEEAVALLTARLVPAEEVDRVYVRELVARLDAPAYRRRIEAHEALAALGPSAVAAMEDAARGGVGPEAAVRLEALIDAASNPWIEAAESLREIRAVHVLERIASPEARKLLTRLAGGAEGFRITAESERALRRLDLRAGAE